MYEHRTIDYCSYEQVKEERNRLVNELADMTAEKERCRLLAVDWSLKADGYKASLEMCENMKLAHEFEELLQTTSIPVAVEKVKGLIKHWECKYNRGCDPSYYDDYCQGCLTISRSKEVSK